MDDVKNLEPEDARKAALLDEAKKLKAAVDPNWTVEQIEKVVSKKRAAARANSDVAAAKKSEPAPEKEEAAGQVEGDETSSDEGEFITALQAELSAAEATVKEQATEIARLIQKTKDQEAIINDVTARKDAAELSLFELKQEVGKAPKDNAKLSEDFGGEKDAPEPEAERPAKRAAARNPAATVTVRVVKAGHDKIFTGRDDGSRYQRNDSFECPAATAADLEAKGWVETD